MKVFNKILIIAFLMTAVTFGQLKDEGMKRQAMLHMQAGRYGEAIDLLNKYISINARSAEGYNLRGLCFEKRSEYEKAVLDFRRASKLAVDDNEIKRNLQRTMEVWHRILYNRIDGFKREIAIDPSNPFNYLEIGKSYRWLEEWALAEQWYDEYLARDDDASPDEIIRYSIILAHTGSIVKGEKILKKYVERYPEDWRLWSRYGYFTLWLGKYDTARNAFTTSLGFKPFFKEAQDGLDLAKNEPYVTLAQPREFERVDRIYPIDRYYNLLRNNPNDDGARFSLIEELLLAERFQEAYEQMNYLAPNYEGVPSYESLRERVETVRQEQKEQKIEDLHGLLKDDPQNSDAVRALAEVYSANEDYQDAINILSEYLAENPNDDELQFFLAQIFSYDRQYDPAYEHALQAVELNSENPQYNLLTGQLEVWLSKDPESARYHLEKTLQYEPDNLYALIAMGTLNFQTQNYDESQRYADKALKIAPDDPDVDQLLSMLEFLKMRVAEDKLIEQLNYGRELAQEKNYYEALPYYEDYISKTSPTPDIMYELADVYVGLERYDDAIAIYDDQLSQSYDPDMDKMRAKVIYWSGDSLRALDEFERLVDDDPSDLEMKMYLGDSYAKMQQYPEAKEIYSELLEVAPESYDIEQRLDWLPPDPEDESGFSRTWRNFTNYLFSYMVVSPLGYGFTDDLDFSLVYGGIGLEIGLARYISVGGTWQRGYLQNDNDRLHYTQLMGHVYIRPIEEVVLSFGYGEVYSPYAIRQPVVQTGLRYTHKEKDRLTIGGQYIRNDAAFLLYSPYLVRTRLLGEIFSLDAEHNTKYGLYLSGLYQYILTDDRDDIPDNVGNNFRAKVGRRFYEELLLGYEYFFSDFRYNLVYYYTPQEFSSHSLFAVWQIVDDGIWDFRIGGKIGYIPQSDYLLRELNARVIYDVFERLRISGNAFWGNTFRDEDGYTSASFYLTAFWTLY